MVLKQKIRMLRFPLNSLTAMFLLVAHMALLHAEQTGNAKSIAEVVSKYQLGPGDKVRIQVYGEQELGLETTLSDAGTILYPFLGEIRVADLTVGQLADLIAQGLKGPYLLDPEVSVSVLEYRKFFINGEVLKPGAYPYQPGLTVQKAVSLAGGFSARASRSSITIVRDKDSTHTHRDADLDTMVAPGDILTVEERFF